MYIRVENYFWLKLSKMSVKSEIFYKFRPPPPLPSLKNCHANWPKNLSLNIVLRLRKKMYFRIHSTKDAICSKFFFILSGIFLWPPSWTLSHVTGIFLWPPPWTLARVTGQESSFSGGGQRKIPYLFNY